MKRISYIAAFSLLLPAFLVSCSSHGHNNIDLTVSESDQYVTISTYYDESNQYKVDECMDKHFGNASNMSFAHSRIKGDITMDNGTNFYIEKKPGFLDIKFNKDKNSTSAYREVKAFGDDLKVAIAD